MPLPGKLCIGILEEDNPQKSYFRFKPLLVEENGLYVPYAEPEAYPEDGCIRIVPDKNESSHFKARMRRIGLFAVVDLREHPSENDKIRVNKNFHSDDAERNAHIIYSDVVREPAAGMIFSLLPMAPKHAENAVLSVVPDTARVLLRPEDAPLESIWTVAIDENEPDVIRLQADGADAAVADMQIFDIPGFRDSVLSFAILPPTKVERVSEPPVGKSARTAEVRREPEAPQPIDVRAAAPAAPAPQPVPAQEKPWITHDNTFAIRPVDPGLPPEQRSMAAQMGLNPRRGRSLQEIVDEKWRHSRMDQLGHSTADLATGAPVPSPVETAVGALRSVWDNPAQREALVEAVARFEGLENAIDVRRAAMHQSIVNEQLNELEAQRLKLLADMEHLKRKDADVREMLKQEIRADEAGAFADAVKKTQQAQSECARAEEKLARIRSAADSAQDALNALVDGRFEQRLHEFAINSRAAELLRHLDSDEPAPARIDGVEADAETLIERVCETFAAAGQPIDRNDAINLLICAAQSPVLLFSGASGSGKSSAVRLLARALGVHESRYAEFAPGRYSLAEELELPEGDAPAIVLLDDANLAPGGDLTRGLTPSAENGDLLLCATLQDDGAPVPAHLFGRAFTLRLSDEAATTPWQPAAISGEKDYEPVTLAALKAAFAPKQAELPENICNRLAKLRADLALLDVKLSRKTLTALWNYCAAAIPMMALEPSAVLDLALAQRAIPAILAGAPLPALAALPKLVEDLPRCKALLSEPLPVQY